VARAVTGRQAGQCADNLHVQIVFGNGLVHEIIGAARGEHGVGRHERLRAFVREAGCRAHQKLLGHAHLIVALGKFLREDMQVRVLAEVGRHADHIGFLPGQFDEGVTERRRARELSFARNRRDHRRGFQTRFAEGCVAHA